MSATLRKFVAVLMLLWLPLAVSNALAASIAMQTQQSDCQEMGMSGMQQHDMSGQHHDQAANDGGTSCNTCGACHLACAFFLNVPSAGPLVLIESGQEYAGHLVSYTSVSTVPLLPPPLARA